MRCLTYLVFSFVGMGCAGSTALVSQGQALRSTVSSAENKVSQVNESAKNVATQVSEAPAQVETVSSKAVSSKTLCPAKGAALTSVASKAPGQLGESVSSSEDKNASDCVAQ